jgi:hypothetical protein
MLVAGLTALLVVTSSAQTLYGQVFVDTFGDNVTSLNWSAFPSPAGPTVAEANGQVEFSFPATIDWAKAEPLPPAGKFVSAGYVLNCTLPGDFRAELSYSLTTWPVNGGVALQLWAGPSNVQVDATRLSWGDGNESYYGSTALVQIYSDNERQYDCDFHNRHDRQTPHRAGRKRRAKFLFQGRRMGAHYRRVNGHVGPLCRLCWSVHV